MVYKHSMKTFAVKEGRPAPATVRSRPYVHAPFGPVQRAQQARIGRILRSTGAQAKLTIGQPNDRYEQEADRVADQVMAMPDPRLQRQPENEEEEETLRTKPLADHITPLVQRQEEPPEEEEEPVQAKSWYGETLQRMCPECAEELAQRQPAEEEDEELQTKQQPGRTSGVTSSIESRIHSMKGGGQSLDATTRNFFEPRFGRDFSDVRLHTDSAAADTARSINARAFTLGNHVAMGSGEYHPNSQSGQRLLGHELTHVVQQTGKIQRYPATTPHGRAYTAGVMHDHRPSGRWAAIQSGLSCWNGATECACSLAPPRGVLMLAYLHELSGYPLAQAHLGYYARGVGTDYTESVATFIARDSGVRSKLSRYIGTANRGHFKVNQSDYTDQDFRYAFGALDRLDYEVDRAAGTVHVWFVDRYEFHPVYPGFYTKKPGDVARVTNCVHAAAVELKASGAADFWMVGYGTVPLATVTGSSSTGGGGGVL